MKQQEGQARAVAEIQGLYGPFSFPEKLLQQIWLRGDFDTSRPVTTDGRVVKILHPGKWNLLGGPDFKAARLKIGETLVTGDVEIHLRAADWVAHHHADDRAYDGVVLHVILFPVEDGFVTEGADGRTIPTLALLPLLHHDLEEYAADDAVERLAGHPLTRAHRELAALPLEVLRAELLRGAKARWRLKVHFAALRIERLGWSDACHHTALEILGYRFNRAPMLSVASAFPLETWIENGEATASAAFEHGEGRWGAQGVRPANHPRTRLRQYARWVAAKPDWPAQLAALAGDLPDLPMTPALSVSESRRNHSFGVIRSWLADKMCGGTVGGPRLETLVCDGFMPLLAARANRHDLGGLWFAWFPGDNPENFSQLLRELGAIKAPAQPYCHGLAQGLLAWMLASDQAVQASGPNPRGRGA